MTIYPDRGAKHTCAKCVTRFYDLHKLPAACPKCGQKVPIIVKAPARRRGRRSAGDAPTPVNALPANMVIVTNPKPRPKYARSK